MALISGRPSKAAGAYQRLPYYYLLSSVAASEHCWVCNAGYASLAPQDDAQEVQIWTTSDSVSSDSPHIFHKQIREE